MFRENRAAAWAAAVVLAGIAAPAWAEDVASTAPTASSSIATERTHQEPGTPLMAALDDWGLAAPLTDANIRIIGHIEGGFTYSASSPPGNLITGRIFDFQNESVLLDQAMVAVERPVTLSGDRFDLGARAEWMYGADARRIHSTGLFDYYGPVDPKNQFDPTQVYVDLNLPVGTGLRIRAGKFITALGYEVIDPTGNLLYSHSFMFGAVPFTHTGVTALYNLSDRLTIEAGASRGWDDALEDKNAAMDFIGRVNYQFSDTDNVQFSMTEGPERAGDNATYRTALDVVANHQLTDAWKIGGEGLWVIDGSIDTTWYGLAAYSSYTLCSQLAINGRIEWFSDENGAVYGVPATLYEATLGLAITPMPNSRYGKGLVIRPEVRFDYANKPFFDGGTDRYQFTAAIDAYYAF